MLEVEESRSLQNIVNFPFLALPSKITCVLITCESLNLNIQSAVKTKCVNYGTKNIRKMERGVNGNGIYRKNTFFMAKVLRNERQKNKKLQYGCNTERHKSNRRVYLIKL